MDVLLVATTAAVTAIGVLMVYSTTRVPLAVAGFSPGSDMTKQLTYVGIAAVAFLGTILIDYKRYLSWAPVLYVGSLLLLLATLAIGRTTLGATSWIQVGSIEVEPSEIVKVTFIISLAALLASRKGNITGRLLVLVLALSLPPFLLIYKQDALGSAMVLAVVLVGMLLMAGTKGRHMVVLALIAVVAIGGVTQTGMLKQYQKDRLVTFLEAPSGVAAGNTTNNPYAAGLEYNLDQSKAAIADGGIEGRGLFKGPETNLSYVPNQDTDFIFTAMAEQFGFVGSVVLLALFAVDNLAIVEGGRALARSGRVADLRRGPQHADVPGLRKRGHDHGHNARRRDHPALFELRRFVDGRRLGGHRLGRKRRHAPFQLVGPQVVLRFRSGPSHLAPEFPGVWSLHSIVEMTLFGAGRRTLTTSANALVADI